MVAPRDRAAVAAEPLPEVKLSIIIPVLNEADNLPKCLDMLYAYPWMHDQAEVIVSDGGSTDETLHIASTYPCGVLSSPQGRSIQMNHGAEHAKGNYLLFLHADSRLPESFDTDSSLSGDWGFFRLRLDGHAWVYRIIETAINLRTGLTRVAGGDQGLFFAAEFFNLIQGFPPISLMEDIAICKQARKQTNPHIVPTPLLSSSRRWQQNGIFKTILLMWLLRLAFWLGVSPQRLHRIYYPQQG